MTILKRQADLCSNCMPHHHEYHLPFFRKTQVFESFCNEYRLLHDKNPLSSSYFLQVWKNHCFSAKDKRIVGSPNAGYVKSWTQRAETPKIGVELLRGFVSESSTMF